MKGKEPKLEKSGKKGIVIVVLFVLFVAAILFFSAGTINYFGAWLFLSVYTFLAAIAALIIIRKNPGALNARGGFGKNVKGWDKITLIIIALAFSSVLIVAGLDFRYKLSSPSAEFTLIGVIVLVSAVLLVCWTMCVNSFAALAVRVYKDQKVVSAGPYRYVRHPMYAGMIISCIAVPLILGSFYAQIPSALTCFAFVARTHLEDNELQKELKGYKEYAKKVKYRLVPWVW